MEFIKPYSALIEKNLQSLTLPTEPNSLYAPQKYIIESGGKRIRPILVLMSCGLCGGDPKDSIPAATAVELLHNFTLIHDDIMDQAESRRGNPAVHMKWNEATAILAGDGMFVQALLQLQHLPSTVDHKRITKVFLDGINTVCEGQALDMDFETRDNVTLDEYLKMISGKTAALLSASMVMGGLCATQDEETLNRLNVIGTSLGLAFQIQDDWLDVVADPDRFGKRKAGDIYEGKKTFLMISALDSCSESNRRKLQDYMKHLPLNDEQVQEVIEIYKNCGVSEKAEEVSRSYYRQAEETLEQFADSSYKEDISNLINYLKNREI